MIFTPEAGSAEQMAEQVQREAVLGSNMRGSEAYRRRLVGTLVRRCSITRYRANTAMKRNSHYDMCMEELETFLASPQQAMEEHYAARELAAAIERFLDTQSKENRVLFMRRYWYADSFAEIGKLLGITEGNARLRLTRMRKQLKTYLTEQEVLV